MTTTTTPNYLDSLLGGGGSVRFEGNGIEGQQVTAVVHLGEGTTGDYDVASQTVEVSATPVSDLELGLYYYGVGAAGLNSVSTFTSGGPVRELGYDAVVSPSAQKFYTAYPTSWGHAFVVLAGSMVEMLAPRAIAIEGQAYTLLESAATASGASLGYYVTKYASAPGSGGSGSINHTLLVDGTNGTSSGDGSPGGMFKTIAQAMNHAVSVSMVRPIVALAPGVYTEEVAVPEQLHGIILSNLVLGAVDSSENDTTVRLVGDISGTSYQDVFALDLNRVVVMGNIISRNPIGNPAQLVLRTSQSQILGSITAASVNTISRQTVFYGGPISASVGAVVLNVDRSTRKTLLDVSVTPSPTYSILDGPLTVAQGGDPGGVDGTFATDTIKQVKNYPDGRRIWQYERMYSLILANGEYNTDILITESEHGGDGLPYSGNWPIVHVRLEIFCDLPSGESGVTSPVGFASLAWEGAIDKNGSSGTGEWSIREPLSRVTPSWETRMDVGSFGTPTIVLSGTANRNVGFSIRFSGPKAPPSAALAIVTLKGTGRFAV